MKTEAEIRAHLIDLKKLASIPCHCGDPIDQMRCTAERDRFRKRIDMLTWVLGENPRYDEIVPVMAGALAGWEEVKKT